MNNYLIILNKNTDFEFLANFNFKIDEKIIKSLRNNYNTDNEIEFIPGKIIFDRYIRN